MRKWFDQLRNSSPADTDPSSGQSKPASQPDLQALQHRANERRAAGDFATASHLYQQALDLDASFWPAWLGLGLISLDTGQLDRAEECFRSVEALHKDSTDAPYFLGLTAQSLGQANLAVGHFLRALRFNPGFKPALLALAPLLKSEEELLLLERLLRTALRAETDDVDLRRLLGIALHALRRNSEALLELEAVYRARPSDLSLLINRAEVLAELGRGAEAEEACAELLKVAGDRVDVRRSIGWVYLALGEASRARQEALVALRLAPDSPDLYHLLGKIDWYLDDALSAQRHWQHALGLDPEHVGAKMALAEQYFYVDDFTSGWPAYEARLAAETSDLIGSSEVRAPLAHSNRWQGEEDRNGTLYLWAEQGFGDFIMMLPWVRMAQQRFQGRVRVYVPAPLARLSEQVVAPADQLQTRAEIPEGSLNCPVLGLPLALHDLKTPLPRGRFLEVPKAVSQKFSDRVKALRGMKVGLVWAGSKSHAEDRWRSISLDTLAPLAKVGGVSFVSLQKGIDPHELDAFPAPIADFTHEIDDFADSAALIDQLDLLISIDSAPAHLAGAIGKPVWMLSRYSGEWRWGRGRNGSNHWYQSLCLYSQSRRDDWSDVIARLLKDLRVVAEAHQAQR